VAGAEGARETEGGGGREETGRSCRSLWAAGRTWALTLREVGVMEGCGQGREEPDSRAFCCFESECCNVVQAGFQLSILALLLPECWDSRLGPPCLALIQA
jgi:hypothetical protein